MARETVRSQAACTGCWDAVLGPGPPAGCLGSTVGCATYELGTGVLPPLSSRGCVDMLCVDPALQNKSIKAWMIFVSQ